MKTETRLQDEGFCKSCMKYHPLHYTLDSQLQKHLILECPKGIKAIAFVPGLNIPTKESKRLVRITAQAKQQQLF